MVDFRLPIVDDDDGVWGDILRQYLMKEHYNDDTDNPSQNGGHQTITIRPGTAAAGTAPLKFASGTLLSTPEAGAIEFNSDRLYFTNTSGPTRQTIATYNTAGSTGDIYYRDGSGNFTRLAIGSTNDVLTVSGGLPAWSASGVATKLDSADFTNKARSAANLAVNPDFEDITVGRTNYGSPVSPGYSTAQSRSGTRSWAWTTPTLGSTSGIQFDLTDPNISTNVTARIQPGDKFYIAAWIYPHASNNHGAGGAMQLTARFVDSTGSLGNTYQSETIALSSLPVSQWTKLHVSLDTPSGYDQAVVFLTANTSTPAGNTYYVDDLVWQAVSTYRQGAELELFNTKDEETNYEKARHYWSGNTYTIATEKGGTGADRPMQIIGSGTTLGFATNGNSAAVISRNATQASVLLEVASTGLTKTSGNQAGISINPTINQTGTAGYTGLLVNPTESSTGSGTKLLADFQLGGVSMASINTAGVISAATGTASNNVVTVGGTQTLTNKTLTAPKLANGGYIADANSQVLLGAYTTASAVNFITVANAATGGWPVLGATGTDTNVGMWFSPKGTGSLGIYAPSGQTAKLRAGGIDANHNLDLIPKGSGTVQANGIEVTTISGTQTLTNKTINASNNTITNLDVADFAASSIVTEGEGIASNDNDTTLPTSAAVKDYVDVTLSPTFQDDTFTIQDNGDTSKQARFELSGITTSTTRTFTLPDANTTLVGIGTVQTLTNKTITSPRVNNILDTNGATILNFTATASADNYLTIANGNATWVGMQANGASASIPIYMYPKAGGAFTIYTSSGYTPTLQANGQDTNLNLNLTSKGTGTVQANGVDVVTTSGAQTLTNKTINASNNTLSNIAISHMAASAIVTEGEGINSSDNDTSVPTTAAVKDYVDAKPPLTWTEVTGTSQTTSVNRGYITNNAGLVTVTLPTTAAVGDTVKITGKGAGGWRVAQNSGETIHFGNQDTTTGAGGRLDSTHRYDCVELVCTTANNDWVVVSSVGNINIT